MRLHPVQAVAHHDNLMLVQEFTLQKILQRLQAFAQLNLAAVSMTLLLQQLPAQVPAEAGVHLQHVRVLVLIAVHLTMRPKPAQQAHSPSHPRLLQQLAQHQQKEQHTRQLALQQPAKHPARQQQAQQVSLRHSG